MAATAAQLVDHVIPDAALARQWALSLLSRVPFVCAHDPAALAAVSRFLVRAVSGCDERAAARFGKLNPRAGATALVQRFDSALRLNVHFHAIWLDGVYSQELGVCATGEQTAMHAPFTPCQPAKSSLKPPIRLRFGEPTRCESHAPGRFASRDADS
jgi:hypothetical protein